MLLENGILAGDDTRSKVIDIISALARFGLAAVWILAGLTKIGKPMTEAQNIMAYEIFTPDWSYFLGQIIGPVEIAGGLILLVGIFIRQAAKISLIALIFFMIGIAQAWYRGLVIDCGCFGDADLADGGMSYVTTLLRDVVFVAMSIWVMVFPYKRFAIYP
ncbi:MauE/DoxX family redox-associated membrane protein [Corynebacterium sp. ES2775-CONJ]|uniref:MauE/DoxX family redox-associated membrane protein n=1 Tax=Corynebacterium sp. ES2775-CONJ TaxID=2974029 RepID=UPI002168F328|nr:MauE/DoxX family redox-associated membrane protein [Corynebacterium sp. ES2775-CONJ]MCS4490625.1 DoxX family membrane protein [Corynebacterium sp. ES2775-CONJ]